MGYAVNDFVIKQELRENAVEKPGGRNDIQAERRKQSRKEDKMTNSFLRVDDVAKILDVSKSYAYKIVQRLNKELESMGYITISGRVNKQYFMEKTCYGTKERKD